MPRSSERTPAGAPEQRHLLPPLTRTQRARRGQIMRGSGSIRERAERREHLGQLAAGEGRERALSESEERRRERRVSVERKSRRHRDATA